MWRLTVHDVKRPIPFMTPASIFLMVGWFLQWDTSLTLVISNPAWLSEPPRCTRGFLCSISWEARWDAVKRLHSVWLLQALAGEQSAATERETMIVACLSVSPLAPSAQRATCCYLLPHQDHFTEPGWGGMEGLTSDLGDNSILVKWPSDHELETGVHVLKRYTQTSGLCALVNVH